jgi:hypothetical protein
VLDSRPFSCACTAGSDSVNPSLSDILKSICVGADETDIGAGRHYGPSLLPGQRETKAIVD